MRKIDLLHIFYSTMKKDDANFHHFMRKFELRENKNKRPKRHQSHTLFAPPWGAFHIPEEECARFVNHYLKAHVVGAELNVMERPAIISPLCVDNDLKFKEATTRLYELHNVESVDRRKVRILTDFLQIKEKQIMCYLFEKNSTSEGGIKDGFHLVYPDVVIGKEMKGLPLK